MPTQSTSIIIADDLQFSRGVIKSGLLKAGYSDVRTADSGHQAITLLSERHADVVLADYWMPGMNGLEMTRLIRRWDEYNDRYTGIVLLTAEDASSSLQLAFDQSVDDFVTKSATQAELFARIQGAARVSLGQKQLRAERRYLSQQLSSCQKQLKRDNLTQLPDYHHLLQHLDLQLQQCHTRKEGLMVAALSISSQQTTRPEVKSKTEDAEQLPKIVIKTAAAALQLVLRPLDYLCRYNNNSFVISFSYRCNTQYDGLLQRFMQSVQQHCRYACYPEHKIDLKLASWQENDIQARHSVELINRSLLKQLNVN